MSDSGYPQMNHSMSGLPLEEMLMRLRHVRRRLERWRPSADSLALLSTDYAAVFGAAKRLESTVNELDSGLGAVDPDHLTPALAPLIEKLELSTSEFEDSILRTAAVA